MELPLFAVQIALPRVQQKAAEMMDRFLVQLQDGQWHKAKDLSWSLHTSDRVIRAMAEQSSGRVISGQEGYKLTRYATNDEIDHAEGWLISQANKMKARAVEIRRARNAGGRAA